MSNPMRPFALALLTVAALGCADTAADEQRQAELDELRTALTDRTAADEAFEERLGALEGDLTALTDRDPAERLEVLEEQLAQLETEIDTLAAGLTAEAEEREELAAALDTATGDLRRSVTQLQGSVDGLRGEVDELRTLYSTLRDRLDRTQR